MPVTILNVKKNVVETQRETFNKNIQLLANKEFENIKKYEKLIPKDKEIIKLRNKIVKNAASQLENGVITSTDYIKELNLETQSKIDLETHKIQLLQSKVNYITILGDIQNK